MPARLTLCNSHRPAVEKLLGDDAPYTLGRAPECELQLAHPSVSRRHAELASRGEQGWLLTDLGSRNGSRVDGRPVARTEIKSGQLLTLGRVHCRFEILGERRLSAERAHRQWRLQAADDLKRRPQGGDLHETLDDFLASLVELIGAQRGLILLGDTLPQLRVISAAGIMARDFSRETFAGSLGALERALSSGEPSLCMDAGADAFYARRESVQRKQIAALACVPLRVADRCLGVVYTDSRECGKLFTELDWDILNSLCQQVAVNLQAIELQHRMWELVRSLHTHERTPLGAGEQRVVDARLLSLMK